MENYQVKLVDFEEKSVQEVEETLLRVHEEKQVYLKLRSLKKLN